MSPIGQSPIFFARWRPAKTKQEKPHSSSYWPSSTPNRVGEKRDSNFTSAILERKIFCRPPCWPSCPGFWFACWIGCPRYRLKKAPHMAGLGSISVAVDYHGKPWSRFQVRESSDNPILNAFCRVAPSLRLRVRAMLAARLFVFASVFNVRTCAVVHARRFNFLTI